MTDENEFFSQGLNPPQKEAVNTLSGPLLILAGAGSGKTRVLTYRAANLIVQGLTTPDGFLAVTFTNKAAREMESRVLALLEQIGLPVYERPWVSTFHSTCARILRDHLGLFDYQPGWSIYDSGDQLSMIKKVVEAMGLNEKIYPAKSLQAQINKAKTLGLSPNEVDSQSTFAMDPTALDIYEKYEEALKQANAVDFGDLLLKTYQVFRDHPDVLQSYQRRFPYIMVDEYQDTNRIQYLLVHMLAKAHGNLCVVGDEDQSIYSWRGADISNILDFEKDFPNCKTIKLEENYRSTATIVQAATALIKNNSQRKDKTLFTKNADGHKISVSEQASEYEEARYIASQIESQCRGLHRSLSDIAVFYRTNAQSRVLEEQLRSRQIPYRLVGGIKFYDRKEIKDVVGYLKLALNPADDLAFLRVINTPARGIGNSTIEKIEGIAQANKFTLLQAAAHAFQERAVHAGAVRRLSEFLQLTQSLQAQAHEKSASELYKHILDSTGLIEKLKAENTIEADARIENLEEFYNAITQFEDERGDEATLQKFLEEMALVSDADEVDINAAAVTLMTLHISKGLEYPCVFIAGMEEGLFPSIRSNSENDDQDYEEERRLAYVGMTRAREKLYLTLARRRRVWGVEQYHAPSRFIAELPIDLVDSNTAVQRPAFLDKYVRDQQDRAAQSHAAQSQPPSFNSNFKDDEFPSYEEASQEADETSYAKGMKVRHATYGVGSVYKIEGNGEDLKVSILFRDNTIKKFVAKHARLERLY